MRRNGPGTEIALIGMACRFPGADTIDDFWKLLVDNHDAVTEVPADRFPVGSYHDDAPSTAGKTISRFGGFLGAPFEFDASFFGIAPVEARSMDPQQRLLLQVTWEALESAGIRPSTLAGSRTGVFVGQATADYRDHLRADQVTSVRDATGSRIRAITPGRISYALDTRGPSMIVDTACSSSLVAVHTARQSLLSGESELAIAGGVNLVLSPFDAVAYSQGGMLSGGGRCRFGDTHADGFVRSEGVGVVILKRLDDALRDGDPIVALLPGSAVTNDGAASGLLLQPSVAGQVEMVTQACRSAGLEPWELDYVEAHGTGTPVGDRVELTALTEAVRPGRADGDPLPIGSVKSNIGHAEAAAGIAGLIKAVLIAQHGLIPASLHARTLHPALTTGQLQLVVRNQHLDQARGPARVGVSSFGLSGTNAHVVVTGFRDTRPVPEAEPAPNLPALLVLSARSRKSLLRLADSYARYLEGAGSVHPLAAICAEAALHRDADAHRLWAVGGTHEEIGAALAALSRGEPTDNAGLGEAGFGADRRTVFVFGGQGSQWAGMGAALLRDFPAFRTALAECDAAIRAELGCSVIELLTQSDTELPDRVEVVQPALWAVQVALAVALRTLGVEPGMCLGHSMGEVAAAYTAGALDIRDAARVICRRSRLMARTAGQGAMLAVELGADAARDVALRYGVCVAAENSPTATVLAGDRDVLDRIAAELGAQGVLCRPVQVNVASHSPYMAPVLAELRDELADLAPQETSVPMTSTVHGGLIHGADLTASYWADNLRSTVSFTGTAAKLAGAQESVFVEVGPHPILVHALTDILTTHAVAGATVPSLRRHRGEYAELARTVGRIFVHGGPVRWECWYPASPRPRVPLPSYPWAATEFRPVTTQQRRRIEIALADVGADRWTGGLLVHEFSPLPPAVVLATVLGRVREALPSTSYALKDVIIGNEPVDLDTAGQATIVTTINPEHQDSSRHVTIDIRDIDGHTYTAMTGSLRPVTATPTDESDLLDRMLRRCRRHLTAVEFHAMAEHQGIVIGHPFAGVRQVWYRHGEAAARVHLPQDGSPVGWETALQPLIAAWSPHFPKRGRPYVPIRFTRIETFAPLPEKCWSLAHFTPSQPDEPARADVLLVDEDGQTLAMFTGIRLTPLRTAARRLPALGRRAGRNRDSRLTTAPIISTGTPLVPVESGPPSAAAGTSLLHSVAAVLDTTVGSIDPRRSLRDQGLDSLLALQLRRQLRIGSNLEITAERLLQATPIADLLREVSPAAAPGRPIAV